MDSIPLSTILTILHSNILQFNNILLTLLNNHYKLINISSQKYNLFDTLSDLYNNITQLYIVT